MVRDDTCYIPRLRPEELCISDGIIVGNDIADKWLTIVRHGFPLGNEKWCTIQERLRRSLKALARWHSYGWGPAMLHRRLEPTSGPGESRQDHLSETLSQWKNTFSCLSEGTFLASIWKSMVRKSKEKLHRAFYAFSILKYKVTQKNEKRGQKVFFGRTLSFVFWNLPC